MYWRLTGRFLVGLIMFCQTLMSVSKGYTTAVLMPFATTLKGRTIVHVNLDLLEMAKNAKVRL